MKILTLNTHSLAEENATEKMELFAGILEKEQPEVMAFQEVNQTMAEPFINEKEVSGYQPVNGHEGKMRRDNYGASLAEALRKKGLSYYWTWIPVKVGYDKYDEGLAIFSKSPILSSCVFNLSASDDYYNWKTRKTLGIHTEKGWFFIITGKRVVHLVSVQEMSGTMRYTWAGGRMKKSLLKPSGKHF